MNFPGGVEEVQPVVLSSRDDCRVVGEGLTILEQLIYSLALFIKLHQLVRSCFCLDEDIHPSGIDEGVRILCQE